MLQSWNMNCNCIRQIIAINALCISIDLLYIYIVSPLIYDICSSYIQLFHRYHVEVNIDTNATFLARQVFKLKSNKQVQNWNPTSIYRVQSLYSTVNSRLSHHVEVICDTFATVLAHRLFNSGSKTMSGGWVPLHSQSFNDPDLLPQFDWLPET